MRSRRLVSLLLLLVLATFAQTNNYWSWNFNTHSSLLGGAVVAGNAGPSSIFYNPALIDQQNQPSLTLSANVMSMQFFSVENLAGNGVDGFNSRFKVQPRFISYVLNTKNQKIGMEVVFLSPTSEEIRMQVNYEDTLDILNRSSGEEVYTGYLNYLRKYDDMWAGYGLSYEFTPQFSVGASVFFADRIQRYLYHKNSSAYHPDDTIDVGGSQEQSYVAHSSVEEEVSYWHVSLLWKVGVAYSTPDDRMSLGLNITPPGIPLFGQAEVRKSYTRINVYDNVADTFTSDESTIGYENKNGDIVIKSPLSIALGAQYVLPNLRTTFTLSSEYFHSLDAYTMIESDLSADWIPTYLQTDQSFMAVQHKADNVVNVGMGLKQSLTEKATLLCGFRTDFTAGDKESNLFQGNEEIRRLNLDKYHISSGAVFHVKKFHFVAGLQYTLSRENDLYQAVNFTEPIEFISPSERALEGVREQTANAAVDELAIFFGFSVGL